MLRVYIKPPGDDWVEYTPIVRADREFEIGGRAYNGEADQGTITIDDPDNTLDEVTEFGGHREVKITVDDSGSEKVLALGRIGPKSLERGQHPLGRELTLTIEDVNAELRGINVDKWRRPEETGRTRVAALRLAYLRGSLSTRSAARDSTNIDIDDFFPDALTETMPAKYYEGTDPLSIIRECAEFEGKLTFVYPQDNGDKELFYAVPNDLTLHNCTLEVSDDSADVDDDTVFAPWWNAGPALSSDPMETITGLTLIHPDGQRTYDNLPAAEVMFDKWEESMFTELAPGALADTQMASILNARDHEEKRRQFSLRMPESKVHLIKQGMLLHIIKADAANVPDGGGGSQKYRIGQIRYRWHGPDAVDDNAFLVIVTLEATTKLKLRHGRRAQATKTPPTPRPAPEQEPQPEDTLTEIACWHWTTNDNDDTDTYAAAHRHAVDHAWTGPAGSIGANHADLNAAGEATEAFPVVAGTTLHVSIGKFRWKWDPSTRWIKVKFWTNPSPSGFVSEWMVESGSGRARNVLYTDIGGTQVVPATATWATVSFETNHSGSVIDDLCVSTVDAADVVENDPAAVDYGPDCPHGETGHYLPAEYVMCRLGLLQDDINSQRVISTDDPTATDDEDAGYPTGTIWINEDDNTAFISVDDAAGAAVWQSVLNADDALEASRATHGRFVATYHRASDTKALVMYSDDGLTFRDGADIDINGSRRDPSLIHWDGTYWVVLTHGTTSLRLYSSTDLETWTGPTTITVDAGATQSWAPEWIRNLDGTPFLHPSTGFPCATVNVSTDNETTFTVREIHPTNRTMTSWSSPVTVTGTGLPTKMIDAFLLVDGDDYWLWFKNEGANKRIEIVQSSTALTSGYTVLESGDWAGWYAARDGGANSIEGPCVVRLEDGRWRIYFNENNGLSSIRAVYSETTDDWRTGTSTWTTQAVITTDALMSHGTVNFIPSVYDHQRDPDAHADLLGSIVTDLDGLSDVTLTSPAEGDMLRFDGSVWVNTPGRWEPVTDGVDTFVWDGDQIVMAWKDT